MPKIKGRQLFLCSRRCISPFLGPCLHGWSLLSPPPPACTTHPQSRLYLPFSLSVSTVVAAEDQGDRSGFLSSLPHLRVWPTFFYLSGSLLRRLLRK